MDVELKRGGYLKKRYKKLWGKKLRAEEVIGKMLVIEGKER